MSTTTPAIEHACPECRTPLVTGLSPVPWCPACRWNLEAEEPDRVCGRPMVRWARGIAFRRTVKVFDALRGRAGMPSLGTSRSLFLLLSALLCAAVIGLAALGVWLCVEDFPSMRVVPGLLCLVIAWQLRPKGTKLDPYERTIDRHDAPGFHALLERVATSVGAKQPYAVAFESAKSSSSGITGTFRRRRILRLNAPLWMALSAQERVALLAHELGHFANGDPRRMTISRFGFHTLLRLAVMTRPGARGARDAAYDMFGLRGQISLWEKIASLLLLPLHKILEVAFVGAQALALDGCQRAEYRADAIAVRVAGRAATAALLDTLVLGDGMLTIVTSMARAQKFKPEEIRAAVADARERDRARAAERRQWTVRVESTLQPGHPPSGLRAELVAAYPDTAAQVTCTEPESARIDAELAKLYEKARLDVAHLG